MFEEATIQRLADEYLSELQALVAHCCEERNRGLTPSDFPLADIDQARLDSLPLPVGSIADLYPLSPMQQGMLFHSLYEEGAGDYINQMQVEVEGLDVARFRLAWEATLEAHDVLRSGFVWEGELGRPLQVVHKSVSLPLPSTTGAGAPTSSQPWRTWQTRSGCGRSICNRRRSCVGSRYEWPTTGIA